MSTPSVVRVDGVIVVQRAACPAGRLSSDHRLTPGRSLRSTVSRVRRSSVGTVAVVIAMSACSSTPESEPTERKSVGKQEVTVGASGIDIESRLTTPTVTSERDGSFVETFTMHPTTSDQQFAVRTRHTPGSRAAGDVRCWISVDGRMVSENTDSGEFAIASCAWSARAALSR